MTLLRCWSEERFSDGQNCRVSRNDDACLEAYFGALAQTASVGVLLAQTAAPPAAPPKFEATKVAESVYSFRYQFHRNMFLVTSDGVIVTDPLSPDAAAAMMGEIRKVTDKPVRYVIYTHEHWDHALGGKIFKDAGAKFISQENCLQAFRSRPNPALVVPDETYKDRRDIKLGDTTVELHYFGRNHGNCMTVLRLPKEKILVAADIVGHKRVAFRAMPDYWPADWIEFAEENREARFRTGHSRPWRAGRSGRGSAADARISRGSHDGRGGRHEGNP